MSKYLEKISRLRTIIKQNGGIRGSMWMLMKTDELKWGKLVGEDKFGNKYYQNDAYFMGRSRWVVYTDAAGFEYDGSQVPPEWHRWLHYIGDEPPTVKPPTEHRWLEEHRENPSGTSKQYVPYSTTRPKVEAWKPPPPPPSK